MKTKKAVRFLCMALVAAAFLFASSVVHADGTWDTVSVSGFTGGFWSIAYGNGTYVATSVSLQNNTPSAGSYRFTGRIYTSSDMQSWTQQGSNIVFDGSGNSGTNGFPVFFIGNAMNQFVAYPYCSSSTGNVATSKILASANGTTWTEKYSGNDAFVNVNNFFGTFYAAHMTRSFDASSNTTTFNYKIRTSRDLDTWTDRYTGTYSGSGSLFNYNFSVGRYDEGYVSGLYIQNTSTSPSTFMSKILLSTDLITWTERYTGNGLIGFAGVRNTLAVSLSIPPATLGLPGTVKIITTTDGGITWTERYNQPYNAPATFSLGSNNYDKLVGWIGVNDSSGNYSMKMLGSDDGNTWTETYSSTFTGSGSFSSMSQNPLTPWFGTRIAVTNAGQTTVKLLLSPTGSTWPESYSHTFTGSPSFTPAYRNGSFLAWGYDGTNPAILKYNGPVAVWAAGAVREAITENPISGATVSIVGDLSKSTATGVDGRYTLSGLTSGVPYTLKITKDGYRPLYVDDVPYTPPGIPDYTINNRPWNAYLLNTNATVAGWGVASNKGVVACRVSDATTVGTANISGVTVTATGSPSGKTYTASYYDTPYTFTGSSTFPNGRAFFLNVDDGDTLTINASAPGWAFLPQTFPAFAGGVTAGYFVGMPAGAAYPISGVVRDMSGNLPLGAVTLRITDMDTGTEKTRPRTSEAGYYMANLLSPGNYTITPSRPGYDSLSPPDPVTLTVGSPNATRNIYLAQTESLSFPLSQGWNFISFPKLPANTAIETALADIYSKVNIVYDWDSQNQAWKKWRPGGQSNTLSAIESGKGYWVYMDIAGSIDTSSWASPNSTNVSLYEAWNLVGYLGTNNTGASAALASISGKWNIVWNWDNGVWSGKHVTITSLPAPIQTLSFFNQGKGYWIKVKPGMATQWAQ